MQFFLFTAVAALILTASAAAQVYSPIAVTGYTQDVIADATGLATATTTTNFDEPFSGPGAYVLYKQGFNTSFPTRGVPANGLIATSANRSYQLGPIAGNNSLQLDDSGAPGAAILSGTLAFATPAPYAALSLLLADGVGMQPSQGGTPGTLAVNWSNGNSTTYPYTVYDWALMSGTPGPNSGIAITDLDRAYRSTGAPQNLTNNMTLFYYDIDLAADPNYVAGALIDSVTANRDPASLAGEDTTNIMAINGATAVPEPSTLALLSMAAGLAALRRRLYWRAGKQCCD
jgi:hypothetical protein